MEAYLLTSLSTYVHSDLTCDQSKGNSILHAQVFQFLCRIYFQGADYTDGFLTMYVIYMCVKIDFKIHNRGHNPSQLTAFCYVTNIE